MPDDPRSEWMSKNWTLGGLGLCEGHVAKNTGSQRLSIQFMKTQTELCI